MYEQKIKYCISISNKNSISKINNIIPKGSFIEYRLDTAYSLDEVKNIIINYDCIIAPKIILNSSEIKNIIELSPKYIDIDFEKFEINLLELLNYSAIYNVKTIVSYHLSEEKIGVDDIRKLVKKMFSFSPNYVKVVFNTENSLDINKVFSLYDSFPSHKLLLFGIGQELKFTRLEALRKGSPFMYVAHSAMGETAAGQFTVDEIQKV
ncbi:MAG TPA: type I 3-dehydroquinate dehydratase [Candidatus Kapabacteria bacterium]|jgi:3-dehydroquinate dehydratase type I|nr:type I 3-dehydroquinate dehydratase [Candidatus Kapabacteria bacterium]HOQ49572.1 type I 3-dehydroquinate dehydratase [Candidatus Kapabacteria bacterium]HPP38859.1 type I 3-dehydroquinate dehydratase [Candidatus Kapabacteria bacterium]